MTTLDYAQVYETRYRKSRHVRRAVARVAWAGLFLVRPRLALSVFAERRSALR